MLSHTECSRALAHLRHATLLYVLLHLHTYVMIRACTNVQINFQTVLGLHVLLERKVPHHVPGDLDVAAAADAAADADDGGGGDDVGVDVDVDVDEHVGDYVYVDLMKMLKMIFILMLIMLKCRF